MAGPSNEWRRLYERWSYEPAPPWLLDNTTSNDERQLIDAAGALCDAVVTGQICPRGIPEAEHLLKVARGRGVASTPLQKIIQQCLTRRVETLCERAHQARSTVMTATVSLKHLEEQVTRQTITSVPPEPLTRDLDAALEQLASRCSALTVARTKCNTLRNTIEQHYGPLVERLQQSARVHARRRAQLADNVRASKQRLIDATHLLTKRKARNLLRPDTTTDPPPDPRLLEEQDRLRGVVSEYERQLDISRTELDAVDTTLENTTDKRDRMLRKLVVSIQDHERSVAEAERRVAAAREAISRERFRVLTAHNGELEQLRLQIAEAEQELDQLSCHSIALSHTTDVHGSVSRAYIDLMISLKSRSADQRCQIADPAHIDTLHEVPPGWFLKGSRYIHDCIDQRFPCSKQEQPRDAGDGVHKIHKWIVSSAGCTSSQKRRLKRYLYYLARTLQSKCTLDSCTALSWYRKPGDNEGPLIRTELADCLYHAKYYMDHAAQDSLVGTLEQALDCDPLLRSATAICAVPGLPSKTFDLPHELAVSLTKRTGIPDATSGIKKTRETARRMKDIEHHEEKIANIDGVFEAVPAMVAGERLILIDDTIGPGVTLWAAAKALYAAGAAAVFGLTCCKNWVTH